MHDLLANVDGRAEAIERLLDGNDRAVDAGAVAARGGEQHAFVAVHRLVFQSAAKATHARHRQAHNRCTNRALINNRTLLCHAHKSTLER
ncbi:hypothetical protein GCM10010471_28320 [Leucobacter komagatae]